MPRSASTRSRSTSTTEVPDATVWLDFAPIGTAPQHLALAPGEHVIAAASGDAARVSRSAGRSRSSRSSSIEMPDQSGPLAAIAATVASWHGKVPSAEALTDVLDEGPRARRARPSRRRRRGLGPRRHERAAAPARRRGRHAHDRGCRSRRRAARGSRRGLELHTRRIRISRCSSRRCSERVALGAPERQRADQVVGVRDDRRRAASPVRSCCTRTTQDTDTQEIKLHYP